MKYVSVAEMIAIEKAADQAGHSYASMMEAAGKGLAEVIQTRYQVRTGNQIVALVGSGNNGGDALVALDYLLRWGWEVAGLLLRPRSPDDVLLTRVAEQGGRLVDAYDPDGFRAIFGKELEGTTVLIDGVLGTGIKLPIREPLNWLLEICSEELAKTSSDPTVVAVDCPSGVDCDSGEVSPYSLKADLTVTMAAVKSGTLKFPAYNFMGEIELVEIGLPEELLEWDRIQREIIGRDWVVTQIPDRPLNAHKGTFGTVLVLAGSQPYPGAAVLSGRSAYRVGAGLVTMAVPESIYSGIIECFPEATWVVLPENEDGIQATAASKISAVLGRPTACLIGPGWGTSPSTGQFLANILRIDQLPPLVIDADGLRLLSGIKDWDQLLPAGSVLTPHPGEMSLLCGLSVSEIQARRVEVAEKFADQWGQIVLLKGAHTVIAAPDGETRILVSADPALARAGSGDVLAGVISGLIAQGLIPFSAAAVGAWLHSKAGGKAAEAVGSPAAVLAGDISDMIGKVLGDLTSDPT